MTKSILTKDEVKHIAHLADLPLTDDELALFAKQLSSVLDYINKLSEVDTKDVEPTSQVTGLTNILRSDDAKPCLSVKDALNNTQSQKNFFKARAIFSE